MLTGARMDEMMTEDTEMQFNPSRGRADRADVNAGQRRRRNNGNLNRMAQFKLDCIDPSLLDTENYVYRWVNDEPGKIRQVTKADDYDFVPSHELGKDFDLEATDSESSERVRMLVGKDGAYAYLVKKPREFWEEDNRAMTDMFDAKMNGRIYNGETDGDPSGKEGRNGGDDKYYVPSGVQAGSGSERRRGPVPRKLKA